MEPMTGILVFRRMRQEYNHVFEAILDYLNFRSARATQWDYIKRNSLIMIIYVTQRKRMGWRRREYNRKSFWEEVPFTETKGGEMLALQREEGCKNAWQRKAYLLHRTGWQPQHRGQCAAVCWVGKWRLKACTRQRCLHVPPRATWGPYWRRGRNKLKEKHFRSRKN